MPGGDGTGPMRMGPMTGGGRGYCAMPAGRYVGRRLGSGRGLKRSWLGYGAPYPTDFTPQQEAEMLKQEAMAMQDEIQSINQRIAALESGTSKAK